MEIKCNLIGLKLQPLAYPLTGSDRHLNHNPLPRVSPFEIKKINYCSSYSNLFYKNKF